MNKALYIVLLAALLLPFEARAGDTGQVSEIFACDFNEGKTWADFERVNTRFGEILKEIGGAAADFRAFVWRPFRGNQDLTYLWAGYFENYRVLGEHWQAIRESGREDEINALWGELETCQSGLTTAELIYDSPEIPADDAKGPAVLESFRCTLQPGKTLEDVNDAVAKWQTHVNDVGLPFDVYMRTPIVSGSSFSHSYFVVHRDLSDYGANISEWRTHPNTPEIDAMLNEVQSCRNALWESWQAYSPD